MKRVTRQLELPAPRTWGGRRDGAGRKPASGRRRVRHRRRAAHDGRCPAHVTLRACGDLPSLRPDDVLDAVRGRVRERIDGPVPHHPIQRSTRSHPPPSRGGRAHSTSTWRSGSRDSHRQGDQSHAAPPRQNMGGQISRASARDSPGGPARTRLRPTELAQAPDRRAWSRSPIIGSVVHGMVCRDSTSARARTDRDGTDLARIGRLAAAWTPPLR